MMLTGSVGAQTQTSVTVDYTKIVGTNRLSLGFALSSDLTYLRDRPVLRQLAEEANFGLVRFFSKSIQPCIRWNDSTLSGMFDWAGVDLLVQRIFEVGAEPLICIGFGAISGLSDLPAGMKADPTTKLPYVNSYAAYCNEWVKHFKQKAMPVRYYEIVNEPWAYFGWNPSNTTKLANYVALWNAAARRMRAENAKVLLSQDAITQKKVLAYWTVHGDNVDFLDFHKYDSDNIGQFSDAEMFSRAEVRGYQDVSWSALYGINTARQIWFNARGKWLPAIDSESAYCSTYLAGTNPKIQQMAGAIWVTLSLRMGILTGLDCNLYFDYASSKSWDLAHKASGGFGFGMVNTDDNQPWYPYYVQKLIGSTLAVGDQIVESKSSSSYIESLAWIHEGRLNTLLICKNDSVRGLGLNVYGLQGISNYSKIDNSISYLYPRIQTGSMSPPGSLGINGYTVVLLQTEISTLDDGFESGNFVKWSNLSYSYGETAAVTSATSYTGSYCARFASNGGANEEYAFCSEYVNMSEVYVHGYFNIGSALPLTDNQDRFYLIRLTGSQNLVYAGIRHDGGVDKWVVLVRNGVNWMNWNYAASPLPQKGGWVCVELHWKMNSTQGLVELYVDGVRIISISGINTAYYGNTTRVDFGLPYAFGVQKNLIIYADSAKISKTYIGQ